MASAGVDRARGRRVPIWLLVALVACASVVLVAVTLGARLSAFSAPSGGSAPALPATPSPSPDPAPLQALPLLPGTRTVFFGDSWTEGYGLAEPEDGFAYLAGEALSLDYTVDGAGGTGYLNPNATGPGPYATRLAALQPDPAVRLLVLQGGLNDEREDLTRLPDAVFRALTQARRAYPRAVIVMVGPASPTPPATGALREIDAILASVAEEEQVRYISPADESWITVADAGRYIDAQQLNHPSAEGHAYLAGRLVEALETAK